MALGLPEHKDWFVSIIVYGIPNCDTVKKARTWLAVHGLDFAFHDYKKAGVSEEKLAIWCEAAGWEKVLNRAGTTFRKLPDAQKQDLDAPKAIAIMVENPSCIKRPIVEFDGGILVGFKEAEWASTFGV